MTHSLELVLPELDLCLDGLPLRRLNFAHYMALNDDLLVELVDLRVDNLVLDRFNRPLLNSILVDVQEFRELRVFKVGRSLGAEGADLKV